MTSVLPCDRAHATSIGLSFTVAFPQHAFSGQEFQYLQDDAKRFTNGGFRSPAHFFLNCCGLR